MIHPHHIEEYLARRYGKEGGIIVRDPEHPGRLREWDRRDTESLCQWLEGRESPAAQHRICLSQKQAAEALGVAVQTVQDWLRRDRNPLPHVREGRRVIIPRAALLAWMEEESSPGARSRPPPDGAGLGGNPGQDEKTRSAFRADGAGP